MLAIAVEGATSLDAFRNSVQEMVAHVKSARPAPGFHEVLVPGEWEYKQAQQQRREGITVPGPRLSRWGSRRDEESF